MLTPFAMMHADSLLFVRTVIEYAGMTQFSFSTLVRTSEAYVLDRADGEDHLLNCAYPSDVTQSTDIVNAGIFTGFLAVHPYHSCSCLTSYLRAFGGASNSAHCVALNLPPVLREITDRHAADTGRYLTCPKRQTVPAGATGFAIRFDSDKIRRRAMNHARLNACSPCRCCHPSCVHRVQHGVHLPCFHVL